MNNAGYAMSEPEPDASAFLDFFRALADSGRLRVAAAIVEEARDLAAVAAATGLPARVVAKHLAALVAAGFAIELRDGGAVRYRWAEARVRTLAVTLGSPRMRALAGASDDRSRLLASFFRDGRLLRLPAGAARQKLIAEEIVQRFDVDRVYSERELNAILKEIAEDYATIRRLMIDLHLMNRQDGVYWVGRGGRDEAPPGAR